MPVKKIIPASIPWGGNTYTFNKMDKFVPFDIFSFSVLKYSLVDCSSIIYHGIYHAEEIGLLFSGNTVTLYFSVSYYNDSRSIAKF